MDNTTSDSSSDTQSQSSEGISLQDVSKMVRNYEKVEKKERKLNSNRNENIGEIVVDQDMLSKIKISQAQLKRLKPKKPRSEKQIESAKKLVDLRKAKTESDKKEKEQELIKLQVQEKRKYNRKPKSQPPPPSDESETSEVVVVKKPKGFQAKKPRLEESDDEIETKLEAVKKIDSVLSNPNPYFAMIMKNRSRK
jgi:hypothetical protein